MLAADAANLKPGDVILVRVRVTKGFEPGTLGHSRGWIACENISDTGLLGQQALMFSCSDAVTPDDVVRWLKKPGG